MTTTPTLNVSEIQNLVTKFYYKNNQLCFQILLQDKSDKITPFKEYTNYAEYKKAYNQLMDQKSDKNAIDTPQSKQDSSYMILT